MNPATIIMTMTMIFIVIRHSLMTFGVKFSASEVDDAFAEMKIDEGMIDAAHLKGLMVSK